MYKLKIVIDNKEENVFYQAPIDMDENVVRAMIAQLFRESVKEITPVVAATPIEYVDVEVRDLTVMELLKFKKGQSLC